MSRMSLSAQARAAVRQRIVDRRYPLGSRLVEREVAEELQMSRVPVREALRALVAEGLPQIVVDTPQRDLVVHAGRIVARDGELS